MNKNLIKTSILGILSVQSLMATTAQAISQNPQENQLRDFTKTQSAINAERIIQKRLLGFDPKQAVETLTYLQNVGVKKFETDGSISVPPNMVQDLMETASIDGIEIRILAFHDQMAKLKFSAYDVNKFDRARIGEAKGLAEAFKLICDMDGKSL